MEQAARQRGAEWQRLAANLETSIARLLPCDPKIVGGISDVSRASEQRVQALTAYLQALAQQVARDTEAAKRALTSAEALVYDLEEEKADLAQEQAALQSQLAALSESLKQRPALEEPQRALQQIALVERQRDDIAQGGLNREDALVAALSDLVAAFAAREEALKNTRGAFDSERARWNSYYAARLARAQTECTIVKGPAAAPAPPAPKAAPRSKNTKKKKTE